MAKLDLVFSGKERPAELNGVYSKASVLWSSLPTECLQEGGEEINCGWLEIQLSPLLRRLFLIEHEEIKPRRMNLSVFRDEESDKAVIFVGIDGKTAKFEIQGRKIEEVSNSDPKIIVERDFGDGTSFREKIKKDGYLLQAFYEIVSIWKMPHQKMEASSLCGTCPAKINGLPGSKI